MRGRLSTNTCCALRTNGCVFGKNLGGALIEVLHPQITQILLINPCNLWIKKRN